MAHSILMKSLASGPLCASCRPLTRPLASWICKASAGTPRSVLRYVSHQTKNSGQSATGASAACRRSFPHYHRLIATVPAAAAEDAATEVPFEPTNLPSVSFSSVDATSWAGDLLILGVFEEDLKAEGAEEKKDEKTDTILAAPALQALDEKLQGALISLVQFQDFEGKPGSTSKVARVGKDSSIRYVAKVGLGKKADLEKGAANTFRSAAKAVVKLAKEGKFTSVALAFPTASELDLSTAGTELTAQLLRSSFESTKFKGTKTKKNKDFNAPKLQKVELLTAGLKADGSEAAAIAAGEALGRGSLLAMYLVDAPPNACTPTHLAEAAAYLASRHSSSLKLEVLEKADCEALGMGCYLGVAECSEQPPKFIHLTYTPSGEVKKKIAVVGKGLTFDSGGYNLKVGASMIELMKFDMGGAAATLGAANIIGALKPENVEVHFIVASCENMVDGKGLRPGDVLTAANGKTVEVNNTDAEGRLTLADALWFAQEKCGVTSVVDAATLTGACIVALGNEVAGLFTPDDKMADAVSAAAKTTGEKVWRLPMEGSYADQLKSSVADMKNTGGRWGGSITAALFLQEFINEGVSWAHVDMAGPVWNDKLAGPTGYGARLLADWVISESKVSSE